MRTLCLLLLVICPAMLHAQESRKVGCRFLCLNADAPPPPLVNIVDKGSEVSCSVNTNSVSQEVICLATDNVIHFLAAADHKPAANATIPANVHAVILVFVAVAKDANALPWRVFVIEDSVKNFPDGGAFVANFHSQDIRFLIGESRIMLHPAACHGVARPEKRDNFNMAPVIFEFQQNDSWHIAKESMLRFLPGMRYLIFAFVDAASGRPRVTTIRDFRVGATAPPKGPKAH